MAERRRSRTAARSAGYDAVVIGAGHNGLVAANLLADAGWQGLVLETEDTPGGAVRSAAGFGPGFTTDLFSAFYPLGAASPVLRGLGLQEQESGTIWGSYAAAAWRSGVLVNAGCHRWKSSASWSLRTRTRTCNRRCAPRGVQRICCFLTMRLLTSWLTADSTNEVEMVSPAR